MSDSKGCFIILLVTRLMQIRSFTILLFGGETGIERPNRDLAVRFDRVVEAVQQNDHPRLGLAYRPRSRAFLSELSCSGVLLQEHTSIIHVSSKS